MRPCATTLAAVLAWMLAAATSSAQAAGGGLRGTVRDHGGRPLADVTVKLSSPNLQGERTTATDPNGVFRFVLLPTGTYRVVLTRPGYRTMEQEKLRIPLGAVITLAVTLKATSMDEVVVTGDAPVVDVTAATVGTTLTENVIDRVPVPRDVAELVLLVPGAAEGSGRTGERIAAGPSIMGGSPLENRSIVDGLETTDPAEGGAGSRVPTSFIQEVRVTSGSDDADRDGAFGGVLDAVTRSGGNELHGNVFGLLTGDAPTSDAAVPRGRGDARTPGSSWDVGFTLGGSLVRDQLWAFLGWNPSRIVQDIRKDVRRGDEVVQSNRFQRVREGNAYATTLTWRATPSSSVVLKLLGDPSDVANEVSGTSTNWVDTPDLGRSDMTTDAERGGVAVGIGWSVVAGDASFLEIGVARHRSTDRWVANLDAPSFQDQTGTGAWTDGVGGEAFFGGAGTQRPGDDRARDQARAAFWWLVGDAHELELGASFQRLAYDIDASMTGPSDATCSPTVAGGARELDPATGLERVIPSDCDSDGDGVLDGVTMPARAGTRTWLRTGGYATVSYENHASATASEVGLWLQDTWRASAGLTVTLGVRTGTERSEADLSPVPRGRRLAFGLGDRIAPRLGLVWDPAATGRSKVFAHYGRVDASTPLGLTARWLGGERTEIAFHEVPESGLPSPANPGALAFLYRSSSERTWIDPELEPPALDEIVLGGELELMTNVTLGVTYIHRSLVRALAAISVDQGQTRFVTNPGGTYTVNPATGTPLESPVTFAAPRRTFDGIEVFLAKRYSDRIQLSASLLWSRLEGNLDDAFRRDSAGIQPDLTSGVALPEPLDGSVGPLSADRTWQLKAYGSYLFRCGLAAGVNLVYLTGTPVSKLGATSTYGLDQRLVTARGSEGRTPSWSSLDLHLGYPLRLAATDLEVSLDLFNLLDRQTAIEVDQRWTVFAPGDEDVAPDGDINARTNPDWGRPLAYSPPRHLRLGLKLSW